MVTRKRIPPDVEAEILTNSKRRCCLCAGLQHDLSQKAGQIAHLDGDRNNNQIDNLAFLCLIHHDEADSRRSQSKGLTVREIKEHRNRLYQHLSGRSPEKSGAALGSNLYSLLKNSIQ